MNAALNEVIEHSAGLDLQGLRQSNDVGQRNVAVTDWHYSSVSGSSSGKAMVTALSRALGAFESGPFNDIQRNGRHF